MIHLEVRGVTGSTTVPDAGGGRLLGVARELRRDELGLLERARALHGDVVRFPIGPPGLRLVNYGVFHPDGVQQVLAGRAFSRETFATAELREAFGNGLLISDGELWRRQRRTIQPLFTPKQVQRYAGVMADEATGLVDRWSARSGPVDAHAEMSRVTLRVVNRVLFGGDVDTVEDVLAWSLPYLNGHVFRRLHLPVRPPWSWPTPANRRAWRARAAMRAVVDEIVARRREQPSADGDLVSLLADARDPDTGEPMDVDQIRDEALVFLLAGHETSATALTFALHLLGRHPRVREQLQAEVDAVLAGRTPDADGTAALSYTAMVVKEAMRLYPPAWALARQAVTDTQIGGSTVPAGPLVFVCPWVTHRHPDFWEEPARFRPERFTSEAESTRPRYAYFPFGGGPHTCIGVHFALQEMVILLATVAQAFSLQAPAGEVRLVPAISLRPRDPVWVRLTRR